MPSGRLIEAAADRPGGSPSLRLVGVSSAEDLARLLTKLRHCLAVWERAVADPRDAKRSQARIVRHALHHHDVHRQRNALADLADQPVLHQTRDEEAGRTGIRIGPRAIDRLPDMPRWLLAMFEEEIGACIDEKRDTLRVG